MPSCSSSRGTARRFAHYSSQWPAWVPGSSLFPKASMCARPTPGSIRRSPRPRALVTHGHADHARGGHGAVWATPETLAIMEVRYGEQNGPAGRLWRERPDRRGRGRLRPRRPCAGIGADRARISAASGWSCRATTSAAPDPTCAPFVPVPCDIFITEATFGLPVFRHPDTGSEIDRLLHRLHADPERCVLVGAYALGKAQRVIMRAARARP